MHISVYSKTPNMLIINYYIKMFIMQFSPLLPPVSWPKKTVSARSIIQRSTSGLVRQNCEPAINCKVPPKRRPEKTVSQPGRELKLRINKAMAFRIRTISFKRNSKFQRSAETSFFLDSFLSFLVKEKRKKKKTYN
jgi:hypothetical protein